MKKWIVGLVCLGMLATGSLGQLIISQYVETDSGTTPKGLELWNAGASTIDFSATGLDILKGNNGGALSSDFTLGAGTLAAGAVMVIGTQDLIDYVDGLGTGVLTALKGFTFNGDDALQVQLDSVVQDTFGEPGVDPGTDWNGNGVSTRNQNIGLLTGITTGNTVGWSDPSTRFETVSSTPSGAGGLDGFGVAPAAAGFNVTFDLADGFIVDEGTSQALTATAAGGTEPYAYAWTSTLAASNFTAVSNVFTILATAPVGSYSATVEASDASPATVTNTINFSVATPEPKYAITITPATNGTVTTTPATEAEEGVTVTINATPDAGYAVDTITVLDSASQPVTVTGNEFNMPDNAVTVTVTFDVFTGSALYISEVADPSDNWQQGRFVELYNSSGASIDLAAGTWNLARQANGSSWANIALTGTVAAGETYVVANSTDFGTAYPGAPAGNPDQVSGSISGNGDDGYFLYSGGDNTSGTLEDAYGVIDQDGSGTDWDYENSRANRKTSSTAGNPTWTAADWTITDPAGVADMTPGVYPDGPPVFGVNFDKANGFVVASGVGDVLTATAVNGTAPYTYAWSSTLGATHYTAVSNLFTILATAPVGVYTTTVVASDSAAQNVTNTIEFSVVNDVATIPVNESYSSTFDWLTLPGWSGAGMSTYSDGDMSFNASADTMTVNFDATPGTLTFDLQGRSSGAGTAPMQFDVEESVDGVTWTPVASLTDTDMGTSPTTLGPYTLLGTSRYVRWTYVNKFVYNVGLNDVIITSGGPAEFSVSVDKLDGFVVDQGTPDAITATAANGTEPYSYVWSSTLGATHYTAVSNIFTILATAPVGVYTTTVVASDSEATPQLATNIVSFSVEAGSSSNAAVIVAGSHTGDVNVQMDLTIYLTNSATAASDWNISLIDPDTNPVWVYTWNPATGAFSFTPTLVGDYSLTATALDGAALPLASTNVTLTITTPTANPDIPPITFIIGTGFTFQVPAGYDLTRVEGAVTTLSGDAYNWLTLTEGAGQDYTLVGSTVTILDGATLPSGYGRMIRLVLTASP